MYDVMRDLKINKKTVSFGQDDEVMQAERNSQKNNQV
jgi:hypothetical protein